MYLSAGAHASPTRLGLALLTLVTLGACERGPGSSLTADGLRVERGSPGSRVSLEHARRRAAGSSGTVAAWAGAGTLGTSRAGHSETLLDDGTVLLAGGGDVRGGVYVTSLASAELYDPKSGKIVPVGPMHDARLRHTATRLANGSVLVAGGASYVNGSTTSIASAELYDPTLRIFSLVGSLGTAREAHTATLMPDGRVLVAGGSSGGPSGGMTFDTAEIYDAAKQTFTNASAPMVSPRRLHTATLLLPTTGMFAATGSLSEKRNSHAATLLGNGRVLVTGGYNDDAAPSTSIGSAEIYAPSVGAFTLVEAMTVPRATHTATLLGSGEVLVAGGQAGASLASVERYSTRCASKVAGSCASSAEAVRSGGAARRGLRGS
jgi:hypothetical protein